jgi:hypothetical protein
VSGVVQFNLASQCVPGPFIYIPAVHMASRVAMMHSPAGAPSMLHCYTTCSKPHHPPLLLSLISGLYSRWSSPACSPVAAHMEDGAFSLFPQH